MPCDGESTLSLFDGGKSTVIDFFIPNLFYQITRKSSAAPNLCGHFFYIACIPSDAEGKALETPANTARSETPKYHHTHYPVKNIRRNQERNRGARRSPHTRTRTPWTRAFRDARAEDKGRCGVSPQRTKLTSPRRFPHSDTAHAHGFHGARPREKVDGHTLAVEYTRAPARWFIRARVHAHTRAVYPLPRGKGDFEPPTRARARYLTHPDIRLSSPRHTPIAIPVHACCVPR